MVRVGGEYIVAGSTVNFSRHLSAHNRAEEAVKTNIQTNIPSVLGTRDDDVLGGVGNLPLPLRLELES
jgi:hypothetical protein